jgi:hypothetical protein
MVSRGTDTDGGTSATRPFAVAGASVIASFGSAIQVTARLAVGATLVRDAYELGTDTFYRASRVTTSASLGIGTHWP